MGRALVCGVYIYLYFVIVGADLDVCLKDLGCMRGTLMPGYQQDAFEGFMGIPFAAPPVGELRFKSPVAASAWTGVLDASAAGSSCLQKCFLMGSWPSVGSEDCLYLNVYRPAHSITSPLPVMVYLHSGGFVCGSACPFHSGPKYLMDTEEVIVVTVNYRLGPFGFLSTGDAQMPGNMGLKDQRLALQWVQQHIESFGGDPQLVTIFGHSAGGISTHLHMLSPNSKGLFHGAMSLSGTALFPSIIVNDPLAQARRLAERAGVAHAQSLDSQKLVEALHQIDGVDLLEAGDVLKEWSNLPLLNYGPVVEKDATPDAFLNEPPLKAHLAGRITQVPWLLGFGSRAGEGSMFTLQPYSKPQLLKEFNQNFLHLFGLLLDLPQGAAVEETVQDILSVYGINDFELNKDTLVPLSTILGDFVFAFPLFVTANSYGDYADQPVFVYNYEYHSNISFETLLTGGPIYEELGACHMDDAVHTLHMPALLPDFPKDSEDELVVKRMTSLLVEFAKTG
ncbi:GH22069 [Drosophila grimshawi]|uniref:Carboxylic ester hydrolase n=2 Tax=Drosophila grimshawi TaxID=7222 RepID=B4J9Y4_DROGR|nr:GH22069 [Drosophila grimshawi]